MKNNSHPGAFLPNGELDKKSIQEAAYTSIALLVAGIEAATSSTHALAWLRHTIMALYNMGQASEFIDALKLLYALIGVAPPCDMAQYTDHPVAANCFMLSCLSTVEELTEGANSFALD